MGLSPCPPPLRGPSAHPNLREVRLAVAGERSATRQMCFTPRFSHPPLPGAAHTYHGQIALYEESRGRINGCPLGVVGRTVEAEAEAILCGDGVVESDRAGEHLDTLGLVVASEDPGLGLQLTSQEQADFQIEACRVIVDDRGKATGEGIVIFTDKKGATLAIKKCHEECYFLTRDCRVRRGAAQQSSAGGVEGGSWGPGGQSSGGGGGEPTVSRMTRLLCFFFKTHSEFVSHSSRFQLKIIDEMLWTLSSEEFLIECIRGHPCLWDHRSELYTKKALIF
ncbi:Hrp65 protein [Chionoecetes opilio]|uniref:Hrp65 protein n=1 Tax=Chionoecetes opilio TaxID=41210 RepID=A0A8J4XZ15_CHIOP|nr:Hrp65 protein [Chionoecetes opilio]